jgi:protein involved in polysaccharide export with SLBB domain
LPSAWRRAATIIIPLLLAIAGPSRGAPASAGPGGAAVDQTIRIDDGLSISIAGLAGDNSATEYKCRVDSDGTIDLPGIAHVMAGGCSTAQLQQKIMDAYARLGPPGHSSVARVSVTHAADAPEAQNYKIAVDDKVTVSVLDLMGDGTGWTVKTQSVAKNGRINLPLLDAPVDAAGLTQEQLAQSISKAYGDVGLVRSAPVSVSAYSAKRGAAAPPTSQPATP